MVFDKTGILTMGNPSVAEAEYGDRIDEALGPALNGSQITPGKGSPRGNRGGNPLVGRNTEVSKEKVLSPLSMDTGSRGNPALMEREQVELNEKVKADIARFEENGNSLVLNAVDGELKIPWVHPRSAPASRKTCSG